MKFFLDANIPYSILDTFKELNLEAVHAKDIGLSNTSDLDILRYVIDKDYILITKDLEFASISINSKQSIIIARLPNFFKASQFAKILKDFLTSINVKELQNAVTILKLGRYRIRKIE